MVYFNVVWFKRHINTKLRRQNVRALSEQKRYEGKPNLDFLEVGNTTQGLHKTHLQ